MSNALVSRKTILALGVITVVAILLIVVLSFPTVYIQTVEAVITLEDDNGIPFIAEYDFNEHDFTYLDWAVHEQEKLAIATPEYRLEFIICDIPPSTDCDSDASTFNWGEKSTTVSLTAPTFIGKREFFINLIDVNVGTIDSVREWHTF